MLKNVTLHVHESELPSYQNYLNEAIPMNAHCKLVAMWSNVHHNIFITLLLGSIAKTVFVKQPCYIQTKMYRLYWKMTIYGHFSI